MFRGWAGGIEDLFSVRNVFYSGYVLVLSVWFFQPCTDVLAALPNFQNIIDLSHSVQHQFLHRSLDFEVIFCVNIIVRGSLLIAVMIHVIAASTLDYHSEVDTIGHWSKTPSCGTRHGISWTALSGVTSEPYVMIWWEQTYQADSEVRNYVAITGMWKTIGGAHDITLHLLHLDSGTSQ